MAVLTGGRILNPERLRTHGNRRGREYLVDILEAGLQAADPYYNARKLLRIKAGKLIVGNPDFEPGGSPHRGDEVFDLAKTGKILVVGAGKGIQRVAKAIEEVLGDRLTGGHIVVKHGDQVDLERIGVTFGAHPVPDEGCVEGCRRILALIQGLKEEDLVFTIGANGFSSLLTLPVPGVTLEDVRRTTYLLQIEKGAPTADLNAIRNHIDVLKGGKMSRYLQPATAMHIVVYDPDYHATDGRGWDSLMRTNRFLHMLPDSTTFAQANAVLRKWDVLDVVPRPVREHLERADPAEETPKADDFSGMRFRIFGVMPRRTGMLPVAQQRAAALGLQPYTLCARLQAESSHAGIVVANIAHSIETVGVPFAPPCALFSSGELLVTVGKETGIGGRNQEYALAAALVIAGSKNIVMGAVDSDGTDGPGGQFAAGEEMLPTLAGGIVDGETAGEAIARGVDIRRELQRHNSSPALWKLDSGIVTTQNISLGDLCVTIILDRG